MKTLISITTINAQVNSLTQWQPFSLHHYAMEMAIEMEFTYIFDYIIDIFNMLV